MIRIINGDCLQELPKLAASGERFHACVTDPPYHLTSIVKRFGGTNAAPAKHGTDGAFARASRGFMGAQWDGGDVAFRPETWRMVYDCMLPGAYLGAFASARGYHRMACAIEDAGFIIHPLFGWLFASGFPKAHRVEAAGWEGWRYGLQSIKPALEPICFAQKPMEGTGTANVLKHGCGALNIDASRVDFSGQADEAESKAKNQHGDFGNGSRNNAIYGADSSDRRNYEAPGRWPANLLHDGSDEVLEAFAAFGDKEGFASGGQREGLTTQRTVTFGLGNGGEAKYYADSGTAARFFFCAKADANDRAGSKHPTVKPTELMRWLVRLITPPGGTVLDPFAGSGSTLLAADQLGFSATGIEMDPTFAADARRKVAADAGMFAEIV